MSVKVKMDKKGVKSLKQAHINALKKTSMKMLAEKIDDQEIPFGEGTLQNVLTDIDMTGIRQGNVSIKSQGPYALRLYYNPQYNFNKESNVNAKGEWWEDWLTGKKADRPKVLFSYFYKKGSGGYVK